MEKTKRKLPLRNFIVKAAASSKRHILSYNNMAELLQYVS